MTHATVTNIQGYSLHDGAGIRTVVFLKGCPLRCSWCANPENLKREPEIGFFEKLCSSCGRCVKVCPNAAIVKGDVHRIDREKCSGCAKCIDECLYGALVRYGEVMDAETVFQKVRRDKMFYDASGGGVTVSGGEPLLYPDFVFELFTLCQNDGINTCIETCGAVSRDAFDMILPVTDEFYFDLKLIDNENHLYYTKADNKLILENARYLSEKDTALLFRRPLIKDVNDSRECAIALSEFIKSCGDVPLQLMPYHRLGQAKYDALNMEYKFDAPIMTDSEIEKIKDIYREMGVECTVSR